MTQCEKILRHMEECGEISQLTALEQYGIMRLASRISDLRMRGIPIESETRKSKNRYGEVIHFSVYRLAKENNE